MTDAPTSAPARQPAVDDLANALHACSYIQAFLRERTPPNADEARQHVQAFDWLSQFGAAVERDWRRAIEAAPLADMAAAVKERAPRDEAEVKW